LAVDHDPLHLELLTVLLLQDGHQVCATVDPELAIKSLRSTPTDLVAIELALPGHDGERVCRHLRQLRPHVPIMIVSSRDREDDVVRGLLFADDYVRKPVWPREFLARVKALLRRGGPAMGSEREHQNLAIGEIELELNHMHAVVNGEQVLLTPREFSLLYALMENSNRVLNREQLIERAWGNEFPGVTKTVDVCILRLRKKLQRHLVTGSYIQTTRGFGYKFEVPPDAGQRKQAPAKVKGGSPGQSGWRSTPGSPSRPGSRMPVSWEDQKEANSVTVS
jgi:DNA-binding response OmpR family regulator